MRKHSTGRLPRLHARLDTSDAPLIVRVIMEHAEATLIVHRGRVRHASPLGLWAFGMTLAALCMLIDARGYIATYLWG